MALSALLFYEYSEAAVRHSFFFLFCSFSLSVSLHRVREVEYADHVKSISVA